jgi:predicted Zn-dependent peptidase
MSTRRILLAAGPCLVLACASPFARPAWENPPAPARDAPVMQPGSLQRAEFANGLRVLVLEDRRLPSVVLSLDVRRGEAMVDPDAAGLVPFTAELMKRGAGERDAVALAEAVDEMGASLEIAGGWDALSVRLSGLSRDLDRLMEILADVVLRPRFEEREAGKARSQQLASLEQSKDNPVTLVRWHTARALYAGHRFGLPLSGDADTVARLDGAKARAFHGRVFLPNNAVFSASGDVAAADLLERGREAFGAWRPGPIPHAGPAPPNPAPGERRILVVDRPDLVQARISVGHEGIERTHPERVAAALLSSVVGGGGFSSRLTTRLRAEAGLTYGVWAGFVLRRRPGPFIASTFTRVSEARRVVDLVLAELERGREEPPSEEELREARALAVGRFSLGLETSDAVMAGLVNLDIYGLPEDALDTYRGRVRATTQVAVAKTARELLHPERAAIILVGPAERLVPMFEDLGSVEVVQP